LAPCWVIGFGNSSAAASDGPLAGKRRTGRSGSLSTFVMMTCVLVANNAE
jgi:hypothetical protein